MRRLPYIHLNPPVFSSKSPNIILYIESAASPSPLDEPARTALAVSEASHAPASEVQTQTTNAVTAATKMAVSESG